MKIKIFYAIIFVLTVGITQFWKTLLPSTAGNAILINFFC